MDVSRSRAPFGRQQDASCPDENCPAGLVKTRALGPSKMAVSGRLFGSPVIDPSGGASLSSGGEASALDLNVMRQGRARKPLDP